MRIRGPKTLAAIGVCAALALAGCGGGSGDSTSQDGETVLRGTTASFPDYLDPALAVTLEGGSAMWNTYVPLLTYEHAAGRAGTKLIPGLAKELPKVSADGRTYTLYMRQGLRYSDGTPIRASDFRHSVERLLALSSGGSPFYASIVGAEKFQKTKKGGIPGIETDDKSGKITIHLTEPRGTFANELALLYAAPLPGDTPIEDLTAHPPPASGPYEIVSTRPGRSWEYRRNPEWAKTDAKLLPQLPGGHVDRIEMQVNQNADAQVNDVEQGKEDWMVNPPPSDRVAALRDKFEGTQLLVTSQISVFYFWMNTKEPPFDDVRVRQAVNYAIDPSVFTRIWAGEMKPMDQILPPSMPGHETFDLYPHDLKKAKELIAEADPAERHVTVWTNSYPQNRESGEYYEGVLKEIGLEPTLKVLNTADYFTVIGNTSTPNLDTGWGNWLLDYPHPNDYFEPQLTAKGLAQTNNTNWSQFVDPKLEEKVESLVTEPLGPSQEASYAALDKAYMEEAPWAPFGTLALTTFVSSEVELDKLVVSPIYGQDLTSFVLK